MAMTYPEALDILFSSLPMFQREGPAAYKRDLDGTWGVLEMCDRPDKCWADRRVIHVAGTNGKGSVCHALSSSLTAAGLRVGLFTSPHLVDFRERIRVNGEMMSEEAVSGFVERYRGQWLKLGRRPSFFELTFGMAVCHFQNEKADVLVLETGMGGRLDSTNIFEQPLVTVVTNIGLDHQQFLGQDIRSIATEKAGILKTGRPVVLGRMRPVAKSVVLQRAMELGAEMYYAGSEEYVLGAGPYEGENLATARAVLNCVRAELRLPEIELRTNAPRGRWQWLEPTASGADVLVDCAHNEDGLERVMSGVLDEMERRKGELHIVFGTVADKEDGIEALLAHLPEGAKYYWCAADVPRALNVLTLKNRAESIGRTGRTFDSVTAAFIAAKDATNGPAELVFVGGSIFVVAEVL